MWNALTKLTLGTKGRKDLEKACSDELSYVGRAKSNVPDDMRTHVFIHRRVIEHEYNRCCNIGSLAQWSVKLSLSCALAGHAHSQYSQIFNFFLM